MWGSNRTAIPRVVRTILAALFWLAIWQITAVLIDKDLLLPRPYTVFSALLHTINDAGFWRTCCFSVLRILLGFGLGLICGTLLAFATSFNRVLDTLFSPMIRVIRATPVASFIILALLWLHTTILPGFISTLMVLPIVWGNLTEGISKTDPQLLELGYCYHFSRWKLLRLIYLPSLQPWLRSACLTSLGLAWKSGVAAEVLCQPREAIGTQLYFAKVYFETDQLFAWTIVVIGLSVLLEHLLRQLFQRL